MNVKEFYPLFLTSTGICTDTRKVEKGNIFIALKGDNFNGNEFADQAQKGGALACIVDEATFAQPDQNIFLVENGLKFLQELAHYHRTHLNIPIIGLTGSNGKTTTKELMAACLEVKYKVAYTIGNFNNHIGVPLTILGMNASHEMGVIEMGANHLGEIEELCQIANPNYGYITNFGKAHLEGFGSEEGVIIAKSELYQFLEKTNGTAFINVDDPIQVDKTKNLTSISFSFKENADYIFKRTSQNGLASIQYINTSLPTHLSGNYNEPNIAAAASIALHFGVSAIEIQKALASYHPNLNRSQEIEKDGRKILLDAYNANPTSMEAALRNFATLEGTKTVILGDMFELGETSDQEHHHIAKLATELKFEQIILIGHMFQHVKLVHPNIHQFRSRDVFMEHMKQHKIDTGRILIKGSRGMALEKVVDFI